MKPINASALSPHAISATRAPFEGVLQILRFNYPMFLAAAFVFAIGSAIRACTSLSNPASTVLTALLTLIGFWPLSTLAVSHLVYDRSSFFRFNWLLPHITRPPCYWANLHAGFDQTTRHLQHALPRTAGVAVDLFDPAIMTERSIHRARAQNLNDPAQLHGPYDHLPLEDGSLDAAFLLFAAHELRTPAQRSTLFSEATRTLKSQGCLIVVEHPRNLINFLAFGPGVFHFHSCRHWLRAGRSAHLALAHNFAITPFARCFIWRKQP